MHQISNNASKPPSPAGIQALDSGASADVRLEGVSKRFGEVWALRPTSLSIHRGEFFSLLGASGSGKTTTLRLIGGFEEPTEGRIFLQGKDVSQLAPYERNVNTVFQDYALFPHMTVEDNVEYGLKVKRVEKRDRVRRVQEALNLVRLSGFGKRKPAQLSGGQRQRVALARALVNAPAVLLLDEPLGALDLKLRREMQAELKRIQRDVGITFLYVTHDQEEAMSMSDRVAVMGDGQIMQVGSLAEVYECPANGFVAGFVAVSNLLRGSILDSAGGHLQVDIPGFGVIGVPGTDRVGEEILITVRPEKISMSSTRETDGNEINCLAGVITDVSYGGPFTRYTVRVGDADIVTMEQNTLGGPTLRAGEEVWLTWPVTQTYVLPGKEEDIERGRIQAQAAVLA